MSEEQQDRPKRTERDPYGDGLDELPPNVPPGFLGERGIDLRKTDDEGSHGLNAGVIQEWTGETTLLLVMLLYIFFFPAAFYVLWRSKKVHRRQKVLASAAMAAGVIYIGWRLLG